MTLRQQWMIVGGVVLVVGIVLGALTYGLRDEVFLVGIGSKAPQFHARKLPSGAPTTLADYKGQVVLLNIWATWCAPCRAEMPDIEQLYRAYGPSGLKVVSVSVDTGIGDSVVTQFANKLGLTFEVLRDSTQSIEHAYQTTAVPESFVIDDVGVIRKKWIGAYAWNSQESRALISHLLGLPSSASGHTDSKRSTPIAITDSG